MATTQFTVDFLSPKSLLASLSYGRAGAGNQYVQDGGGIVEVGASRLGRGPNRYFGTGRPTRAGRDETIHVCMCVASVQACLR